MAYQSKAFPDQIVSTSGADAASAGIRLFDDCESIVLFAPTTTSTWLIVQVEPTSTGTSWVDLKSGVTTVIVPSTGCVVISPGGFLQLRVLTTATEAASRTVTVRGQFTAS